MDVLRDIGYPPRALLFGHFQQVFALKEYAAAVGVVYSENVFEERGLAGAVLAEDYADLAGLKTEADAL